jgi:hypothetical protein
VLFAEIVYVQKESTIEQAIPIFIGSMLAFVFSIALFYITRRVRTSQERKDLSNNVSREISFNINFLEKLKIQIERQIQDVSANNKKIWPIVKFDKLQRVFILSAFDKGILYEELTDDEINTVDSMVGFFFRTTNDFMRATIDDFKAGKAKASDVIEVLRFNLDEVVRYTDFLKLIQTRFTSK